MISRIHTPNEVANIKNVMEIRCNIDNKESLLFPVGTLDVLVGLSEELAKLDSFAESVTRKLVQYMGEVLEEQRHKLEDNLNVGGVPPNVYVTKFQWDCAKYPTKQTLRALHDILSEQVTRIETDLRTKSTAYNSIKGTLQSIERKQTGSLLTRNLADIVKKQQFILGSEYLTTMVVVVPKPLYNEWKASYETLSDMVVPRSSELIYEDQENGLWTVTLFQKMVNDFTLRAREKKFLPRDFVYDEKKIEESRHAVTKLESDKKRQFVKALADYHQVASAANSAFADVSSLLVLISYMASPHILDFCLIKGFPFLPEEDSGRAVLSPAGL
nr:unnamed protein product [Spirometra erinaceieuropaei]